LAEGTPEDTALMTTDFSNLRNNGIADDDMQKHFKSLVLKRIPSISLPLFGLAANTTANVDHGKAAKLTMVNKGSHSVFIEIHHGEKTVYVRKTTVVWLLQEGEWVSADRLFQVRTRQPRAVSSTKTMHIAQIDTSDPIVCDNISIGNVCVFKFSMREWKVGIKSLEFCILFRKIQVLPGLLQNNISFF